MYGISTYIWLSFDILSRIYNGFFLSSAPQVSEIPRDRRSTDMDLGATGMTYFAPTKRKKPTSLRRLFFHVVPCWSCVTPAPPSASIPGAHSCPGILIRHWQSSTFFAKVSCGQTRIWPDYNIKIFHQPIFSLNLAANFREPLRWIDLGFWPFSLYGSKDCRAHHCHHPNIM